MRTLVVSPAELALAELEVGGEAHRHLFRAARLACGDRLRVVDGAGAARTAEVVAVARHSARLRLGSTVDSREPRVRVELLVAPPKPERAAWLVEKVTELGVAAIRFLNTTRDPRHYGEASLDRLRRVAVAALAQSGGARLPAVTGMHAFSELPALVARSTPLLLDPEAPAPLTGGESDSVTLLIGPEGGWTLEERADCERLGARPCSLGARLLRVETAAVAAAALVLIPR